MSKTQQNKCKQIQTTRTNANKYTLTQTKKQTNNKKKVRSGAKTVINYNNSSRKVLRLLHFGRSPLNSEHLGKLLEQRTLGVNRYYWN